jgi:hypothetical protein
MVRWQVKKSYNARMFISEKTFRIEIAAYTFAAVNKCPGCPAVWLNK